MNWPHALLPLILGLVVISGQNVQADDVPKPENKSAAEQANSILYEKYACRGKANGMRLPIALSCVDYYECHDEVATRSTCKNGKHFSTLALTCLDARLSKCKVDQEEEQQQPAVNCEGVCCNREDGLYPAKDACSDFVVCVDGKSTQKSCGGILQFSATNLICDIPERVQCNDDAAEVDEEIIEEDLPTDGTLVKPTMYVISHRVCRNYADGNTVAILGSCNKYYLCIDRIGYLKSCGNLQFNPKTHYCDARTRMYCPAIEKDDVILNEEEYVLIDTRPFPVVRPKPLPFYPDEDEDEYVDEPPYPIEEEDDDEAIVAPPVPGEVIPPVTQPPPWDITPPVPQGDEEIENRPRPRPPIVGEYEHLKKPLPSIEDEEESRPHWGKKPSQRPSENSEKEQQKPQGPSHAIENGHQRPVENKEELKKPKPSDKDEEESRPHWGKKPSQRPSENSEKEQQKPVGQSHAIENGHQRPAENKEELKKPKPSVEDEEESRPHWGKKPSQRPSENSEKEQQKPVGQSHAIENGHQRPAENKEELKKPKPSVEDEEESRPHWGKKPSQRPSENSEKEHQKPVENGNKSPHVEVNVPVVYFNICSEQPVGALLAMPEDCSKYIRCRWDWFEKRVAEIITCPQEKHFNAKTKRCDWPAEAGCIAYSKKANKINNKMHKYEGIF